VAKDFTQREDIDYTETFSPVLCKDSLRIIMTLVTHYDLELYQMDVKTTFLMRICWRIYTWRNSKVLS
jgi:hypothetical protein